MIAIALAIYLSLMMKQAYCVRTLTIGGHVINERMVVPDGCHRMTATVQGGITSIRFDECFVPPSAARNAAATAARTIVRSQRKLAECEANHFRNCPRTHPDPRCAAMIASAIQTIEAKITEEHVKIDVAKQRRAENLGFNREHVISRSVWQKHFTWVQTTFPDFTPSIQAATYLSNVIIDQLGIIGIKTEFNTKLNELENLERFLRQHDQVVKNEVVLTYTMLLSYLQTEQYHTIRDSILAAYSDWINNTPPMSGWTDRMKRLIVNDLQERSILADSKVVRRAMSLWFGNRVQEVPIESVARCVSR
jgi:hypothetical protein